MKVIKRDGSRVLFDKNKIIIALQNANNEIDAKSRISQEEVELIADKIEQYCKSKRKSQLIETIQDRVELELMNLGAFELAKHYIEYRYSHKLLRDAYTTLMDGVEQKLGAKNIQNQNANLDESSFGGRAGEASSFVNKQFALNYCMSEMSRTNHLNNEIYIHDLDSYATGQHNCLSIPFDKLLNDGFKTRQVDIRPAGSLDTAMQLVAVIFQLQSLQQFGGVSATHLDWTMVPFVRKSFFKHYRDGMTYIENSTEQVGTKETPIDSELYTKNKKVYDYAMAMLERECHQGVEALLHNLNSLQSRSGNQLPFSSINYGTCTLPEGRLVIKELLTVSIEGLGPNHQTSIFPCSIFQVMSGVNKEKGTPNYDLFRLALKSTSLRLYPNYCNIGWSGNAGYDRNDPKTYFSTMGCRTANGSDINVEEGTNPQTKDGRGNICPVSIILPTLAMESGRDVEKFMALLDKKIGEAKDMLIERFEWICSQSPNSAKFMWNNGTMLGYHKEEGIRSALKHGTLAIGQLGLAETLQLLIGKDHTTEEGMQLAKRIEQLFKDRCAQFKKEYKLNFGVYYTPAENLCLTAMNKFKEKYGIIPNVSDRKYFTNSMHVPVWHKLTAFEKIDIESQLTGYSSAGCITYVELDGSSVHNIDALEKIVVYAMDKDVPYFSINVPNDQCDDCGYLGEFNDCCPQCGSKNIKQLRRVTGYLTGDYKSAFNVGKQEEVAERVKHTGVSIE